MTMTRCKPLPSLQEVRRHLRYEPHTGDLIWLIDRPGRPAAKGTLAGSVNSLGYRIVNYRRKWLKAHRLAWLLFHGQDPLGFDIDHINQDKLDNRIANLRLATRSQNRVNSKSWKGGASLLPSGKWQAQCRTPDGLRYLGRYSTREEAVAVASAFRKQTYGDFAS